MGNELPAISRVFRPVHPRHCGPITVHSSIDRAQGVLAMNPYLGVGLSYRRHFSPFLRELQRLVDLFEVLPDAYPRVLESYLEEIKGIAGTHPLVAHCTSLSIASPEGPYP